MVNCASCHSLDSVTIQQDPAPSLGLIYNRKAGTDTNYWNYSKPILDSNFFWNNKNLFNFM